MNVCHYKLEIEEKENIWNASGFTIGCNKNLTYLSIVITFVKIGEKSKKVEVIFNEKHWMIKLDVRNNFIYDYLYSIPFCYENEKNLVERIVRAVNAMFERNAIVCGK